MTTGTILYCFILVAIVFFIQWMIIGYCFYIVNKQIDECKEIQKIRNIYQDSWLDRLESILDDINNKIDNLLDIK